MSIHPTAIVSKEADLAEGVSVGPYSVIKGRTKIGKGCVVESHVVIGNEAGIVEIGSGNHFLQGASVGTPPQDLTYKGEVTKLVIGDNNTIREFCTLNLGTPKGGGTTVIGNDCLLMAYVHLAHDCKIGNDVVVANCAQFAGHVTVEDHVKISGGCLFSQFITLGTHCYIAGDTAVNKDILPYSIAAGNYATIRATNKIGLERSGFSKETIESIHRAIRFLIRGEGTIEEAVEKIERLCQPSDEIGRILDFVRQSKKGIAR